MVLALLLPQIVGALAHEGGGSRSEEQGLNGCGYNEDSPLGDDFSDKDQLYSRVWGIHKIGEPGGKP